MYLILIACCTKIQHPGAVLVCGAVSWNTGYCEMLSGFRLWGHSCYNRRNLHQILCCSEGWCHLLSCPWGHLVTFHHWRCQRGTWNFSYPGGHYWWGATWQECEGLSKTSEVKYAEVHLLIWMALQLTARWLWFTWYFIKTPFFQRREWLELIRAWQMEFLPCFSCFLFKSNLGLCAQ